MACLAISRRYGSKPERMIAPGVSSTMRSTPVASSSARMLRPSRPMMRPLRSSLGRSTTDTVVSMAWSAADRWIASVMYCLARSAAVSRASASRRLSRLAASCRASPSICLMSSSLASSAVRLGDALELVLLLRRPVARTCGCGGFDRLRARRPRRARAPAAPFRVRSIAACRSASAASRRASVCSSACGLLALLPRLALGRRQDLVRLFLGVEQRFLLARLGVALGVLDDAERLLLGAADGFGGDALPVGHPDREHRGGRHERDQRVDQVAESDSTRDVLSRDPRSGLCWVGAARGDTAPRPMMRGRKRTKGPRFAVWGGR